MGTRPNTTPTRTFSRGDPLKVLDTAALACNFNNGKEALPVAGLAKVNAGDTINFPWTNGPNTPYVLLRQMIYRT